MDVSGKKVSVVGAGKSGLAAARLLRSKGALVLVSEFGSVGEQEAGLLQEQGISLEQEGHSERVYDADFCVVSPGIPPQAPVMKTMAARGMALYSEIEIASLFCSARIVGITGTDGKTTTSTLVHRICEEDGLRHGYRSYCVGNIGVPFSSMVSDMKACDVAVVELSSYQLERCPTFRPDIAVITNITPDHLDRYEGDLNGYAAAKFRIYSNQSEDDTLIYNEDDPLLSSHFEADRRHFPFRIVPFGLEPVAPGHPDRRIVFLEGNTIVVRTDGGYERIIETSEFLKESFRGRHNIYNALAAVAAARELGIGNESICSALREFTGVEHRQEFVMNINGTGWVNDSKATNINALRQALDALPGMVILIAGGRDKGNDYASIADLVRRKVSVIIAIGESQQKIAAAFDGIVAVKTAGSLEDAVLSASEFSGPGQTVLFSPGCASFDMFADFEDRGRRFKKCVHQLQQTC